MTQEQFEVLNQFESNLETSQMGYTRNISKKNRQTLYSLYQELTGNAVSGNIMCTKCMVDILKELYPLYKSFSPETAVKTKKSKVVKNVEVEMKSGEEAVKAETVNSENHGLEE